MFAFGALFLATALGSLVVYGLTGNQYVLVHGVLLAGALPLMWAAMLHFVPVLTRSAAPSRWISRLPWLGWGGALVALATFSGHLPRESLFGALSMLLFGAALLSMWIWRRGRRAFGAPHPGVFWYLGALFVLTLALLGAAIMVALPGHYGAAYRAHLHLNLFGWVSLTVWGTLPVLLPTCFSQREPREGLAHRQAVAARLRRYLRWALAGALALGFGAALRLTSLSAIGGFIWLWIAGVHGVSWLREYGSPRGWPGPASSLGAGAVGFVAVLVAGGLHGGFRDLQTDSSSLFGIFAAGFLLPIVLGALTQLLPVWHFPGPDSAARRIMAERLAKGAGWRALLCLATGAGVLAGYPGALGLAGLAIFWFVVGVILAMRHGLCGDGNHPN